MSDIPSELRYSKNHFWADPTQGFVVVGITDYYQTELGEIEFVELPEIDMQVNADEEIGAIESTENEVEIYAPITGTIVEVNHALTDSPTLINSDPYATGWIFKIQPDDDMELEELLSDEEYQDLVDA
jgi:glycine cleavage system H protein